MQVSAVSSMNFYSAKTKAAKKAAQAVTPDFSKSAYAVPTGLQKAEKKAEAPFVGDYALINVTTPKTSNAKATPDFVAASTYIEAEAPAVKPEKYIAASMYIEPKKA